MVATRVAKLTATSIATMTAMMATRLSVAVAAATAAALVETITGIVREPIHIARASVADTGIKYKPSTCFVAPMLPHAACESMDNSHASAARHPARLHTPTTLAPKSLPKQRSNIPWTMGHQFKLDEQDRA